MKRFLETFEEVLDIAEFISISALVIVIISMFVGAIISIIIGGI